MFWRARRDWSPPGAYGNCQRLTVLVPAPVPLEALGAFPPWPVSVAPALFTLLTSPSSLSPVASSFCPLPPGSLVLSVRHLGRVCPDSPLSTPGAPARAGPCALPRGGGASASCPRPRRERDLAARSAAVTPTAAEMEMRDALFTAAFFTV